MKGSIYTRLFVISTIFILVLFFLLGLLLNKTSETKKSLSTSTITVDGNKLNPNDSILQQYKAVMTNFDNSIDSVNEQNNPDLNKKLVEYYKLRKEIGNLLKEDANLEDLDIAKTKIGLLQEKINDLRNRNLLVEADNIRLNAIIKQLSSIQKPVPAAGNNASSGNSVSARGNKQESNLFIASDLKIAVNTPESKREKDPEDTDIITGSFLVKNSTTLPNAELYVVLQQPNGKILRNSEWESGIFNTIEGQRKIYSVLLKFDYNKDELRRCNFNLNTEENLLKGKYILQVYHKGVLIANMSKILT